MKACAQVLKPGGLIYFHTPVVTRTGSCTRLPVLGKIGSIWQRGRTSVFHLQNYAKRSLTMLLQRAGFDEARIDLRNELPWPVDTCACT